MTTTPEKKIINYDDKQNLLISILKHPIIYDESTARLTTWEQISAETGISVTQCQAEWKNMRNRLGNHKDKVFTNEKMNWKLARDFLLKTFEEKKLKNSPAAAPSPSLSPSTSSSREKKLKNSPAAASSPSPSPSPSTSSSRVLSPQEEAQNNVLNRLKERQRQQPSIKNQMDDIGLIVQRLPADDAEKLVNLFTELAIDNFK